MKSRIAFYGDSIVRGTRGTSGASARWTTLLCDRLGWTELNFGVDGMGFLAHRPARRGGVATSIEVLDQVIGSDADVCVVSLGLNDSVLAQAGYDDLRTAMALDLAALIDGFGHQRVIVTDLYSPFGQRRPPGWLQVRRLLADVAETSGVPIVAGMATAIDGRSELLDADGLHPNDAGHRSLASAVLPELSQAVTRALAVPPD